MVQAMHQKTYDTTQLNHLPNVKESFEHLEPAKNYDKFGDVPNMNFHMMHMAQHGQNLYSTLIPKPYRGVARFKSPAPLRVSAAPHNNIQRTRNLSRTRGTVVTEGTTSIRPPTTILTPLTLRYNKQQNIQITKQANRQPLDFRPSPLFGLIMDERDVLNSFNNENIEKIHATFRASSKVQNGFFPVIQNGIPSSIL